jgi:hypothetical protein
MWLLIILLIAEHAESFLRSGNVRKTLVPNSAIRRQNSRGDLKCNFAKSIDAIVSQDSDSAFQYPSSQSNRWFRSDNRIRTRLLMSTTSSSSSIAITTSTVSTSSLDSLSTPPPPSSSSSLGLTPPAFPIVSSGAKIVAISQSRTALEAVNAVRTLAEQRSAILTKAEIDSIPQLMIYFLTIAENEAKERFERKGRDMKYKTYLSSYLLADCAWGTGTIQNGFPLCFYSILLFSLSAFSSLLPPLGFSLISFLPSPIYCIINFHFFISSIMTTQVHYK